MNMPDPDKQKVTFWEWTDAVDESVLIREELTKKFDLTELMTRAEYCRYLNIKEINKRRKARGEKLLDLPWQAKINERAA